jgi:hypothetical protein
MLATGATSTAVTLSVLAGWQRGGEWPERLVWVAIGVVLVFSAHMLPALVRTAPLAVRVVACVLWLACMTAAAYGHATFFVMAQRHAGELRAASVAVAAPTPSDRSLTVVMAERANVIAQLATANARRCAGDCRTLDSHRVSLVARLDALNAEADEVRRRQADDDRVTAQRDALLVDPVASRLASLLGTTASRVDLLSALAFAALLECVACLLWAIALRPSPVLTSYSPSPATAAARTAQPEVTKGTTVTPGHEALPASHESPNDPVMPLPVASVSVAQPVHDDVTRLQRDISAGRVRATVADIRRHLGCSQARAAALRRQIAEVTLSA